jgi:hypothetical protein
MTPPKLGRLFILNESFIGKAKTEYWSRQITL